LLRLLDLLGSAGLAESVERTLDHAVDGGQRQVLDALTPSTSPFDDSADVASIARLYAESAEQLAASPPGAPSWRSLGPITIPNGQTYGASRANVSGRVAAVVVDPSDPKHLLVGAANGGVWESNDRGATWAPRTDNAATLTVGALAFDPVHPGTVLCGTGEGNWWSYLGAGILRSTDGGTTWSTLCRDPFLGQGFYDVRFVPAVSGRLLAAVTSGLYSSSDGGTTWTQRHAGRTWSVAVDAGEALAGSADGVHRSTDGGLTWTAVALPGAPGSFDRLAVAIAPSNPAVAYAWGAQGANAYLWRRTGTGWSTVGTPAGVSTGQAWYDWFLGVAPDRDDQVFLGAIDAYRGDLTGGSWTWLDISTKGPSGDSIHPDQHAIAFEPGNPNTLYIGCDGGLFTSPDRGVTWRHLNNGLVISEFEYLAQDATSTTWLFGGLQDNGSARWTGSPTWDHTADGDGGDSAVNRTNPSVVWHTYYGMSPEVSYSGGDWNSWNSVPPPVPAGEGSPFYPPVECSLTNGDTFAIAGNALYVTRDNGANWKRLPYPAAASGASLAIPTADGIWVGTADGQIFRTTWNGSAWSGLAALSSPRPGAYLSDLLVSSSGLTLWAVSRTFGGGRVFLSTDSGVTWSDRSANLPALPVNAIAIDPTDAQRLWVAADLGVYQTVDGGQSWSAFGAGLPNAYVGDLLFNPTGRVLRAGTRNRGVWEINADTTVSTGPLYRYWNATTADHFYTTNWSELGNGRYGYTYEGVQCYVDAQQAPGTVPLHRYWNPDAADHFYTTDWAELGNGKYGYTYEGVQCYVYPGPVAHTTPLHRYWNSVATDHFYTTNWGELGNGGAGYAYEGIQAYVLTEASAEQHVLASAAVSAGEAIPSTFQVSPRRSGQAMPEEVSTLPHWTGILGGGKVDQPPAWTATLSGPGSREDIPFTFSPYPHGNR